MPFHECAAKPYRNNVPGSNLMLDVPGQPSSSFFSDRFYCNYRRSGWLRVSYGPCGPGGGRGAFIGIWRTP